MQFSTVALRAFAADVEQCQTIEEVIERLHEASKPVMAAFMIARPPAPIDDTKNWIVGSNIFLHRAVPLALFEEWRDNASKHGVSPMARRAERDGTTFLWSEFLHEQQLTGRNRANFDLVHRYGISDLFSVPVHPWRVIYSTRSKRFKLSSEGRASLMSLAILAVERCKALTSHKLLPGALLAPLSLREQEVAQLLGNGFTGVKIAEHLKLKRASVKTMATRIRRKMKARNTTHALVLAARHHLIGVGGFDFPLGSCWWCLLAYLGVCC